ncbi:hypothetical protein [Cohnella mopanensis]|uniref:hypothetical protein n=1 Tax=Cohnella mopanensis TaxID=2911966 RepID=UPI001EF8D608|nr:hypothetical protein [Cohnella mopanensis]
MKKILILILSSLILMVLPACGGYSKAEKRTARNNMQKHLEEKYNQEFNVAISGNVHYITIGNPFGGGIAGLKAEAYPVNEPERKFRVEYWEKSNVIEDGYMDLIMTDRLIEQVRKQAAPLLGESIKLDVVFDNGPFEKLPDNKFTLASTLVDYNADYWTGIDFFVPRDEPIDKRREAVIIDELQDILIESGLEDFHISVYYMEKKDYDNLESTLALIEEKNGTSDSMSMYDYCRPKESCWIGSGSVEKGVKEYTVEKIQERFDFRKDILTVAHSGETLDVYLC